MDFLRHKFVAAEKWYPVFALFFSPSNVRIGVEQISANFKHASFITCESR
jgi:hypothetical protein